MNQSVSSKFISEDIPNQQFISRPTLPATMGTILLLTALAAVGQFASNVYTPSIPAVGVALGVDAAAVQLTYVIFLASFAVGQLCYGPLADHFGRRPTLFIGLALFLGATLACALAPSLPVLLAARGLQGFGAAAGLVVSRAATRDSFHGVELTRMLATITIVFALVPGLTPLLGGVVQTLIGWRAIFWLTLLVGSGVILWAVMRLPETIPERSTAINVRSVSSGYMAIMSDKVFRGYAITAGFVFGAMSAFFAASPALFIEQLGVSSAEYGLYPPLAVTGFIIGGLITRRLMGRVTARWVATTGLVLMGIALVTMLALPLIGLVHKHSFNATMVLNVTGLGIFLPTAIASALQRFPKQAGIAAAVQGFLQMGGGALGAFTVGVVQASLPILALPLTMTGALALAVLTFAMIPTKETYT